MTYLEILSHLQNDPFFQMLLAAFCGAVVGLEREANRKPAGIRTCSLVSLGSAIFTIMSVHAVSILENSGYVLDQTRIASNIVQGIGFLGACCVFMVKDKINGITTAAAIWVVASIGMVCGFGHALIAIQATILAIIIMFGIGWFEKIFKRKNKKRKKLTHDKKEEETKI